MPTPQTLCSPPRAVPASRLKHALHAVWLAVALHTGAASATDLNQATEADLDSLRGVGPATTQRLLSERAKGPFASWADLMGRVKGIRVPTARKWSDQGLTVNGQAFAAPTPLTPSSLSSPATAQGEPASPAPPADKN